MVPNSVSAASVLRSRHELELETLGELGIVSLAIIAIGLVVTWTGYVKKVRWTWFVLLTVAWGGAFPVMLLPFVLHLNRAITLTEWISGAQEGLYVPRALMESVVTFSLMIIALILPIKAFFWSRGGGATARS